MLAPLVPISLLIPLTHLNLFALEDIADAGVEGSAGEHGGDRVRQVQNLLKH